MDGMYRKLGVGLVLVMIALSAVLASAAQASFYYPSEHTILSGSQKTGTQTVFTAASGFSGITCTTVEFSGTTVGEEAESQLITSSYSGCSDSLGRTVDIDGSLKEELTESGEAHVTEGITLTITSGSVICTVAITSPQTDNGITYNNLGGTSGVEVTIHSTNVVSTTSGGFFNCGVSNGTHTSGTYDGTATITGKTTEGAAAEIAFGAEKVDLTLTAPTVHVGEEVLFTAKNTGNVTWKVFQESWEEGSWDSKSLICEPTTVQAGNSCTKKFKCTEGRNMVWALKVESLKGVTRKKDITVPCDNP
jgi:hypothetical protein